MGKYLITGGLGGPWKKAKADKIVNPEIIVDFDVTVDQGVYSATTEADFDTVYAAVCADKKVCAKCHVEALDSIAKFSAVSYTDPLAEEANPNVIFSGILYINAVATSMILIITKSGSVVVYATPLSE